VIRRQGDRARLGTSLLGTGLCLGGVAHIWVHGQWGQHDWGAIVLVVVGATLVSPHAIRDLVSAWRSSRARTAEHRAQPPEGEP